MRLDSLGLVLAIGGCTVRAPTLVGEVEGADTIVGIALHDDTAQMYVCGGPNDLGRHHHWVSLTRDGSGWSGSNGALGVTFEGDDNGVLGAVSDDEGTLPFSATPGRRGDGPWQPAEPLAGCTAGVVVQGGGASMQGVHICVDDPVAAQVVPIGVFEPSRRRIDVSVLDDPTTQFTVVPADAGA